MAIEENDQGTDRCLRNCIEYEGVLRSMLGGDVRRQEVEEAAGVSSSTVNRILNRFIRDGLAKRTKPGEYELTPTGEAVAKETSSFRDTVECMRELKPVTESARDEGFDPGLFADGVVVTPTEEKPYEPARRFVEVFRETDSLRLLVVSTATPMFSEEKQRLIARGKETEVVCPEEIVETSMRTVPRDIVGGLVENLTLRVHDDPPFSVALFDDRVGVAGHDDDGRIEVFADTDDDEAYGWGEDVYERYLRESDGLFERFDPREVSERLDFDLDGFDQDGQAWV
jgi:predicted transcriptional regulator